MPPSKKIFIGASAVMTGVLCQILVTWLLTRAAEAITRMQSGDAGAGEAIAQRVDQIYAQTQIGFNAMTMSYVFILSGAIFLLIGIYQTAKTVEAMQGASQTHTSPQQ
jgi:hypothetical protein